MEGNDKVHIDIMDGVFVKTTSPDFESILKIQTTLAKQVHLMVQEPLPYLELCLKYQVDEVIVHLGTNYKDIDFTNYNFEIYFGVNPEDKFSQFEELVEEATGFLLMTVHPGLQGQPFLPEELTKVESIRNKGFGGKIIVDGSVNLDTINDVVKYDIDEAVVGSAIIKKEDPIAAYNDLNKAVSD